MPQANATIMLGAATLFQTAMISLLPATRGYTKIVPTLACFIFANLTIWLFARIVDSGVSLSVLIPFSSAAPSLVALIAAVVIYGQTPSASKILLLLFACMAIGIASAIN